MYTKFRTKNANEATNIYHHPLSSGIVLASIALPKSTKPWVANPKKAPYDIYRIIRTAVSISERVLMHFADICQLIHAKHYSKNTRVGQQLPLCEAVSHSHLRDVALRFAQGEMYCGSSFQLALLVDLAMHCLIVLSNNLITSRFRRSGLSLK